MRQLFYTNYQSGNSGLSNGIMSVECGVVMAFLTNRLLLLDGNISPPANIVAYEGRVDNSRPSRVTDLIDIPIPWAEPDAEEIASLTSRELTDRNLMDSIFYVPGTVDIESADALDFARGRSNWLCEDEQFAEVPLLRVSEEPMVPGGDMHRHNLNYYSYLFYLNDETRRAVYQLLSRMQARQPYADLAKQVAADLGMFNAVHMRRGDFKVTYGVTVLDRHPWEAIDTMERHFDRDQKLLICTDERADPFFDEIKTTWSNHLFIDHHILDNYASEFAALPQHDSLALAYLSQLVAAESADFIGSMTSTFTAMIQRLRGSRGKLEEFKFLWNELPEPGEQLQRGSHRASDCVPMEDGLMVPEFEGAYSWNRYTQLINPAWMREWPESFLTTQTLDTGILAGSIQGCSSSTICSGSQDEALVYFEGLRGRVVSSIPGLAEQLSHVFHDNKEEAAGSVIAEVEVILSGGTYFLKSAGNTIAQTRKETELPGLILRHLATIFSQARKGFSWFEGLVLQRGEHVVLYLGDTNDGRLEIADALYSSGWYPLGDLVVPVCAETSEARPLASTVSESSTVTSIVYGSKRLHNQSSLQALTPSVAVAELTRASLDFHLNREKAISKLCTLAERVPVYQLSFSRATEAPLALDHLHENKPVSITSGAKQ